MTPNIHPPSLCYVAALSLMLCSPSVGHAQAVIAPPAPTSGTTRSSFALFENSESPDSAAAGPGASTTSAPSTRSSPTRFHPHLNYRFLYGDGIRSQAGRSATTEIHEISPGFRLDIGRLWNLEYSPTWSLYSHEAFRDTFEQDVRLSGTAILEDWRLGFSQAYQSSSDTLVETGRQTNQETSLTTLEVSYRLSNSMMLDLAVHQDLRFVEQFSDTMEWSTLEWLHYRASARTIASLGLGFGYIDMGTGPNVSYQQLQAQVAWSPSDAMTLQLHGEMNIRRFHTTDSTSLKTPIYGASIAYSPRQGTLVSLAVDRTVSSSYFQSQVTENDAWSFDLSQRLLQKFQLSVGISRRSTSYVTSNPEAAAARKDDYTSFIARISSDFLSRGKLTVFYQASENSSDRGEFGFSSTQFGIEIGYGY